MEKWYQNKLRRTLLDMHIPDWNDEFMRSFDPETYFKALKTANVNAPMIYVQAHTGLCYWPTKVGTMHKGFLGCEDKMKRLFDLCNADGMSTILYYSLIYNTEEYFKHPEWQMRDVEGRGCTFKGSRYGLCCPNNKDYRAFVAAQIDEFLDYFTCEGVFFDMPFWPMVCYCDSCRARWAEEVGGEMPTIVDWNDPRWKKFHEKQNLWMGEFAQFATDEVKKHNPNISVEHQFGPSMHYWRFGQNELIAKASDYIGTDLYGGIEQQSFACKAWYNLTSNQPFQYMTSRCYPTLAEHTTTKSPDLLRLCAFMTYAHHGAVLLIDAIDPIGTIDERVYEKMGKIYRESEQYEPYIKRGEMAYNVALYYDLNGKMDTDNNGYSTDSPQNANTEMDKVEFPHAGAIMGASNALRTHHIPFGVINNGRPDLIRKAEVLVIPDDPGMKAPACEEVKQFVAEGGKLYFSGHSAPELLKEFFDVNLVGFTEEDFTYMAPTDGSDVFLGEFTKAHPLPMGMKAAKVAGTPKGEVLATITLPYSVPTPKLTFPLDYYGKPFKGYDREQHYGSIHSNPPSHLTTSMPGIMKTSYGKGTVVWSALPIEAAVRPQHSDIFVEIIRGLMGDKPFVFGADAADSVECILFEDKAAREKLLSLVNLQEDFHTMPAVDTEVWVSSDCAPTAVCSLPDEKPVEYVYENGKVKIHIDRFKQFRMFAFRF